jgi:hypothetical protein
MQVIKTLYVKGEDTVGIHSPKVTALGGTSAYGVKVAGRC